MDKPGHAHRPEDIVINPDSEMERGELPPGEKLAASEGGRIPAATENAVPSEVAVVEDGSSDTKSVVEQDEVKVKEENVPDGEETAQEWREGPHRIIERRAGPGEEVSRFGGVAFGLDIDHLSLVEVEAIRNTYVPGEAGQMSSTSAVQRPLKCSLCAYLDKLKHAPHELEQGVEKADHTIRDEAKEHIVGSSWPLTRQAHRPKPHERLQTSKEA